MKKIILPLIVSLLLISCGKTEEVPKQTSEKQKTFIGTEIQTGSSAETGSEQVSSGVAEKVESGVINQDSGFKQIDGAIYGNDEISINLIENTKVVQDSEGKQVIMFGPLGPDLGPKPTNKKYQIYEFRTETKLAESDLVKKIKDDNGSMLVSGPEKININNFDVVKWKSGGMCNERDIEIIGNVHNYKISSLGCSTDEKTDFDYFKKIIESIKYINKDNSENSTFSDSQIKGILTKIDNNRNKYIESILSKEGGETGTLVQGNYSANLTNNGIQTIIKGKKYNFKVLNGEFLGFFGFSPSGNYLYYITNNGGEYGPAIYSNIVDAKTGKNILKLGGFDESASLFIWTQDKQQFIFSKQTLSKNTLNITLKGDFPKTMEVDVKDYSITSGYTDNEYIYTIGNIYNADLKKKVNYLKIYDLKTLKEIFSKELDK